MSTATAAPIKPKPWTRMDVRRALQHAGYRRNSQSWQDYSRAKAYLLNDELTPLEYYMRIKWITEYLGV